MRWTPYDVMHTRRLAEDRALTGEGEGMCPVCGAVRVRHYTYPSTRPSGPTVIGYAWCAQCHRYASSTAPQRPGDRIEDVLSEAEHDLFDNDLFGLLGHLDALWDAGRLGDRPGAG